MKRIFKLNPERALKSFCAELDVWQKKDLLKEYKSRIFIEDFGFRDYSIGFIEPAYIRIVIPSEIKKEYSSAEKFVKDTGILEKLQLSGIDQKSSRKQLKAVLERLKKEFHSADFCEYDSNRTVLSIEEILIDPQISAM